MCYNSVIDIEKPQLIRNVEGKSSLIKINEEEEMKKVVLVFMLAALVLTGCSKAIEPTPIIIYVTPEPTAEPAPALEPVDLRNNFV